MPAGERGSRAKGRGKKHIARRSKRVTQRAPQGIGSAERLTQAAFRERCQLSESVMHFLDDVCEGAPLPRNALARIHAIEFRAGYAYSKPKQVTEVEVGQKLSDLLAAAMGVPPASPEGDP